MAKSQHIELSNGLVIPILYEDRSVIAIDKPAGWLLAPDSWDKTGRNLQLALRSSMAAGDFWARSRNLKYLRFVHRLDADTSGVLLFAKSAGALRVYSELFESRLVEKIYWAVVHGTPREKAWNCQLKLSADPKCPGRVHVDERGGKPGETHFRVLEAHGGVALVEAKPITGRTHQIRVHLSAAGNPVVGDTLYGRRQPLGVEPPSLALRAVELGYRDPFLQRPVRIRAPSGMFVREHGFARS